MRIVLTGATSFLGKKLMQTILDKGHECYAIVRPESIEKLDACTDSPLLHVVPCDVTNVGSWEASLPNPDLFFHLAWSGVGAAGRADPKIQAKNVETTLECMKAAHRLGCKKFIFAGSQAEYGPTDDLTDETHPCSPIIEYGKGKLEVLKRCTELSHELKMDYVHLRIFSVYGEGDHPWTLVSQCVSSFLKGETVDLSLCEQPWNFLYVDDAAEMMYLLGAEKTESGVYNIASTDTRKLKDFVSEIWRLTGEKGRANFGGRVNATEKVYGINPSTDKLQKAISYTPKFSFEQGITSMIKNTEAEK